MSILKKNDILPAILAFVSTIILVALGLSWFNKINARNAQDSRDGSTRIINTSRNNRNLSTSQASSTSFPAPNIVPQGTSVYINGSTRMILVNQALKKSFQRRFPGTAVIADADGSETGLELLRTGETDIAAILRPLTPEEKEQGLAAVTIDESTSRVDDQVVQEILYYVYREPANIEVEAFLGFALSSKGQAAIINR